MSLLRRQFTEAVLAWVEKLERDKRLKVRRIAIDAPSDYCRDALGRRAAERSLDESGISCFATPTEEEFEAKVLASRKFLADGGKPSRLPNANQLWMLVGFELFRTLRRRYECIETYPQAVVRQLQCASQHKSTEQGLQSQLVEAAKVLRISPTDMRAKLLTMGFGLARTTGSMPSCRPGSPAWTRRKERRLAHHPMTLFGCPSRRQWPRPREITGDVHTAPDSSSMKAKPVTT